MKFKIILITLILTISQLAQADTYINCENCNDTKSAALNSTPSVRGYYTTHIFDTVKAKIVSYKVTVMSMSGEPGYPSLLKGAREIQTPIEITSDFDLLLLSLREFEEAAKDIIVPPTIVDTAWDLYGDNNAQTQFFNWVYQNANSSITHSLANLGNVISGSLGLAQLNITINLTVNLQNGAKIVLQFNFVQISSSGALQGIYKIDFEKSRDENGNPLVIQSSTVGGGNSGSLTFENGSQSLYDFLLAADRSGLLGGSNGTSCTITGDIVTCTLVRADNAG